MGLIQCMIQENNEKTPEHRTLADAPKPLLPHSIRVADYVIRSEEFKLTLPQFSVMAPTSKKKPSRQSSPLVVETQLGPTSKTKRIKWRFFSSGFMSLSLLTLRQFFPTCEVYLAAMDFHLIVTIFLFLDLVCATFLTEPSLFAKKNATPFPRYALHHELLRRVESPKGTACQNVYSVLDHICPIPTFYLVRFQ